MITPNGSGCCSIASSPIGRIVAIDGLPFQVIGSAQPKGSLFGQSQDNYVSIPVVPEILRGKVAVLIELFTKRRQLQELNRNLAQANQRLAEANTTLQAEKTRPQ